MDGVTYTKLDIETSAFDLTETKMLIGCALCQNNLYFNQITLQCESVTTTSPNGSVSPTDPSSGN